MLGYTLDNYSQVPLIIWNYIPQFQPLKEICWCDRWTHIHVVLALGFRKISKSATRSGRSGGTLSFFELSNLHCLWIDERYQCLARRVWKEGWQNTYPAWCPFQLQYIYKYLMASYMLESNLQSLLNLLVPNMGVGQSYYYHILREYTSIKPAISGT